MPSRNIPHVVGWRLTERVEPLMLRSLRLAQSQVAALSYVCAFFALLVPSPVERACELATVQLSWILHISIRIDGI